MTAESQPRIHPTAEVAADSHVGDGTRVWNNAQIREGAWIGENCVIGKNVYIDAGVHIGDRVKIQNNVSVFRGVTVDDGVFIGPHVTFTNDVRPRAVSPAGTPLGDADWQVVPTRVRSGASIGANSTILPGVAIGRWAMVGAGSVVTHDVADHALVMGNPARRHGSVCAQGHSLPDDRNGVPFQGQCSACGGSVPWEGDE